MRTFLAMPGFLRRASGRLGRTTARAAPGQDAGERPNRARSLLSTLTAESAAESGVTLIEVVISALLVAIIAIGTLAGFDSAGRATTDERQHNQATLLAAQDEELLRGMNAAELGQLGTVTKPPVTLNGTSYTIESSAQYVTSSKEAFRCETSEGTADYIQTTSKVTWPGLGSREAVRQSSLVAISGSTALLVKVTNRNNEPVEGATVTVTGATTSASQVTPVAGCVIFGAISDKKVAVTATKSGWVNANGEAEPAAKEYSLSSTALTSAEFKIAQPGSILAEFVSNGSAVGVTSDTFYAYQSGASGPFIGGKPATPSATASVLGLFPFAPENSYIVWAGDCSENNPEVDSNKAAGVKNETAQVEPGAITHVKLEVPALNVTVYKGASSAANEGVLAGSYSATLTNTKCAASSALNEKPLVYVRSVKIGTTGLLEQKYQPYAKELQLCVVGLIGSTYYKNTQTLTNIKKAGTSETFYLKKTGYTSNGSPLTC
jgi:hypothetical protein